MVLWQMEGGPLLAELQSFELLAELAKDLGRFPRRHLRSDKLFPRFSGTLRASPSSNRCRIFVSRTLRCVLSSLLMLAFSPRPARAKDHTPPASMPLVLKLRKIASSTYGRPNLELEPIQQQLVKQGPAVIDPLRALLKDPDIRVGAAAATVLQTFDNPQVQEEVLAFALRTLVERPRSCKEPTGPGFFLLFQERRQRIYLYLGILNAGLQLGYLGLRFFEFQFADLLLRLYVVKLFLQSDIPLFLFLNKLRRSVNDSEKYYTD